MTLSASTSKHKEIPDEQAMDLVYRFAVSPTPEQEQQLLHIFYLCRKLYNFALDQRIRHYRDSGQGLSYYDQQKQLPAFKAQHPEYRQVPSQSLQDVLRRLDRSFVNFFEKRAGFPRFKDKFRFRSITIPQCETNRNFGKKGFIYIPKVGHIRLHAHQDFDPSDVRIINVKHHNGKWVVNLTAQRLVRHDPMSIQRAVGIDMGLVDLAVTSDGKHFGNPRWLGASEKKLKKRQRKLSKKQNRSRNRDKAKRELQRAHERVVNQRKDFLHKLSYRLVTDYDLICIEDLSVQGMMNNHRLAKSIANASWHRLSVYLGYKCIKFGKRIVKVTPEHTSQECSSCGKSVPKSLSERIHRCSFCGLVMDRDENAARNILHRGLKQIQSA